MNSERLNSDTGMDMTHLDRMSRHMADNWWAVALRGVAAVLLGLVALWMPVAAMLTLAYFFAAYLLADGVFALVSAVRAVRHHARWGLLVAEGILNLVMGLVAAAVPAAAVVAFVLITAAWAILTGGLMLAAAFNLHVTHGRWWLALGGLVSMIWGVMLLIAPLIGALVLTWWLAAYAIVFGVAMLMLAFQLRGQRHDPPATGAV
jgi:uncharacterized membrane protein HdeD (DUF308 family)